MTEDQRKVIAYSLRFTVNALLNSLASKGYKPNPSERDFINTAWRILNVLVPDPPSQGEPDGPELPE
jgi:hypothetical protein